MRNDVRVQLTSLKLSQAALAEAMGVSRQTINSIKNGKYLPSLPLAFTLAAYFNIGVEELFHERD